MIGRCTRCSSVSLVPVSLFVLWNGYLKGRSVELMAMMGFGHLAGEERCLSYDEKPLLLFQKLKEAGQKPVFMLRHLVS